MPELLSDPLVLALAAVGVILTGISKSGFAGGAGVIAVPLLALVISPTIAVVLMLPLLLLMDAQTIATHRRNLALGRLRWIIPAALIGVVVGSLALGRWSDSWLKICIGMISLVFAAIQLIPGASRLANRRSGPLMAMVMGGISGASSSLIHAGGPPLNMYLATLQLPRALWISTAAVFFACLNLSKVFSYAWIGLWTGEILFASLILAPVAVLGVLAGHRIQQRISDALFQRTVMIALAVSGIVLIFQGLG